MKQIRQAPPQGWARMACLCAAVAVTALLTACGSSPTSTGTTGSSSAGGSNSQAGGSANSQQVAYSQCVRSHGVPSFPDPPSTGKLVIPSAQQLGVSDSQLQAAENACQALRANSGGGPPTQALLEQQWSDMAKFTQCMRSHGVPNWPDPTRYPSNPQRPTFELRAHGIDANSPQVTAKMSQCETILNFPGGNYIDN